MNSTVHLTKDQIDDYLIGDLAAKPARHLVGCGECKARVAELESAIGSFKDVSLAWSERQSATMPVRPASLTQKSATSSHALWVAASAAAIMVGVAIPLAHHESTASSRQVGAHNASATMQTFSAEREEQIAQDNRMLQAIDREIGAPVNSPLETFGLELSGHSQHATRNGTQRD